MRRLGAAPTAEALRQRSALPLLLAALIGVAFVFTPDGAARGQAGDPDRGEKLFGRTGCNGCHQIDGVGGQVGPDLTLVIERDLAKDRPGQEHASIREYIRQSIKDPQAYIVPGFPEPSPMPSAETFGLSEHDIDDLLAYLEKAGQAN